jgi:hypothetical protein
VVQAGAERNAKCKLQNAKCKMAKGLDTGKSEVRIAIDDRDDETVIHLPRDYFGQVELSFRAGVLVNTRKSETLDKGKLKAHTDRRESM